MKKGKAIHVDDPVKGRLFVGVIEGTVFRRSVDPDRHLLRMHNGYALQDCVIDDLVDRGVETIVMVEPYRRLVSSIEDWQEHGKSIDLGHGPQTVLNVSYMVKG